MIHPVVCNPVLSPVVRVTDPVRWRAGKLAPDGAILHWDADIDAFTEQTGGVHTFNHAVLAPQYQLNADGSHTDVGAKPAVDVYDGERWVRSCGAVTNLLPSGSEDFASGWTQTKQETTPAGLWYKITVTEDGFVSKNLSIGTVAGTTITYSIDVKQGSRLIDYFLLRDITALINILWVGINTLTGEITYSVGTEGATATQNADGSWRVTLVVPWVSGNACLVYAGYTTESATAGTYVYLRNPQLTATPYPVPYVPPGVTQPASNATTTNGMWFTLPDGSPMWKALTGEPLTLATRVRMGVGSRDLVNSSVLNVLTPDDVAGRFLTIQKDGSGNLSATLSDGTNAATVPMSAWSRNDILDFFPQVLTGGAQMRIGYKTKAATSITWGNAATYAGTFGPDATLERLMIGYANAYPMWPSRITSFPKQATDAEAMEAMA